MFLSGCNFDKNRFKMWMYVREVRSDGGVVPGVDIQGDTPHISGHIVCK